MTLWERFLTYPFYQNALIAGAAIAVACALLSVFVVQRKMAFIGQGISHAAFGGVGMALLLELALPAMRHPLVRDAVVAVFCVGVAILMGRMGRQRGVGEDSAIGIVLVMAMALGVILLDLRTEWVQRLAARGTLDQAWLGYTPSFHEILFGNILSVSHNQVVTSCVVSAAVILWVASVLRGLIFYAADEEAATTFGLPVGLLRYGLLISLAVTIVMAIHVMGVILVSAMLILPGVTASLWSRRIATVLGISALVSVLSLVFGLVIAMEVQVLSTGPVIVLVLSLFFVGSRVILSRHRPRTG